MVSIQVLDWDIMVIFRRGHSDRGHFDLVPRYLYMEPTSALET